MSATAPQEQEYAGQRLGLPAAGRGSVASWGRRIAALFLDWIASSLVAAVLFGYQFFEQPGESSSLVRLSPLLVLVLETAVFTALVGGSFGQVLLRIVVRRLDGRPVDLLRAVLRGVLICLVIPPLVFNRDNRGLHDLAADTVVLNR